MAWVAALGTTWAARAAGEHLVADHAQGDNLVALVDLDRDQRAAQAFGQAHLVLALRSGARGPPGYVRQGAPGAGVGAFGDSRGDAHGQAGQRVGLVQVLLRHAAADGAHAGAQDDPGMSSRRARRDMAVVLFERRQVLLLAVHADLAKRGWTCP